MENIVKYIAFNILLQVIEFLKECFHSDCGGFGPFPKHDPNLLSTLSAVQIAAMYDIIDDENVINIPSIVAYVKSLQQEDGSFAMDKWGEIDTRFSFCAVATLALLGHLDSINLDTVSYCCKYHYQGILPTFQIYLLNF